MWQVVWALIMTLAAIVVLRSLVRASGLGTPAGRLRRLKVVESVSLGGRQRLHVVDVGGEELLLSTSEDGVRLLRRLPPPPPVAERAAATAAGKDSESETSRWWTRLRALAPPAVLLLLAMLLSPAGASAAPAEFSLSLDGMTGPDQVSSTLEIVALFTLISVAPSILLMATCFTRIFIVLTLLRQALGINQIPPNQVMAGLALFTTVFVMAPVGEQVYADAVQPYMERELDAASAAERGIVPVRRFLLDHTRDKDLQLFVDLSGEAVPEEPSEVSFSTLLPAYMISEMRTAFEIGFMIYLPFLVIDLVIASMLISLGMIVLPPMMIALPFKLMLFVLLDGWNLVLSSLVSGLM